MANTPRSRKAKGRKLQQEIREFLLENFKSLEPDDVKCAIMGESGVDLHLSPAARKIIPLSIEAKNQEKLNIWSALDQAVSNAKEGTAPAVVFRRNRSDTYIALKFDVIIDLLKQLNSLKISNDS